MGRDGFTTLMAEMVTVCRMTSLAKLWADVQQTLVDMKKPTVYLDTSIISAYWYEGANVAMLSRRLHTREWWDMERGHFAVWVSEFVEGELRAGSFPRQDECVRLVQKLRYAPVTATARELMNDILRRKFVLPTKPGDAAHLAISAAHGIDYLLTWNYAHMANPLVQAQLDMLCQAKDLVVPLMVSPESIPQVRFGKSIRRRH